MGDSIHEAFIRESNCIEGILRDPTIEEVEQHREFWSLRLVGVADLEALVRVIQPAAPLRVNHGMDVRVGSHIPPRGGPGIRPALESILDRIELRRLSPFAAHVEYETLHPFIDGNGRSGRALWAWMMLNHGHRFGIELGFLHAFYYQTLGEDHTPAPPEPNDR